MQLVNFHIAMILVTTSAGVYADCVVPGVFKAGEKIQRNGTTIKITCKGEGVTKDLAESDARERCDERVANEYKSSINVKEITISGDSDSASDREVAIHSCVLGLLCQKPNFSTCEDAGRYQTWRTCEYDLRGLSEGSEAQCNPGHKSPSDQPPPDEMSAIRSRINIKDRGAHRRGSGYVLSVSVVPKCDDILIVGAMSRKLPCTTNPLRVSIQPEDREVIVRAKGYLPKTLPLEGLGKETEVEVYLDSSD
jgi:hypothetical protein